MVQPAERADARANRLRLLEAAHTVFRERGLDAEMKEIAERAGVGIGTIYRNFPSKDDLIRAIVTEAIASIHATLETALSIDDPIDSVRALMAGGFAVSERYGDLIAAMMQGQMPPDCKHQFEQLGGVERVAGIIRRGIDRGVFRAGIDAEVAAAQLVASFHPWHYQALRRAHGPGDLVDAHLEIFLHGVAPRE